MMFSLELLFVKIELVFFYVPEALLTALTIELYSEGCMCAIASSRSTGTDAFHSVNRFPLSGVIMSCC